jgi:hypothetical protein
MANKIILKKTSTPAKVPLSTDLEVGEIAINLADQKLYSKNASGTVILVGNTGDVVGGSSSTDNAVARYDGTTGKLIQNSTVTLDDNGDLSGVNSVEFDTTPATVPTLAGSMYWDVDYGTPAVVMGGGNVIQQVGEDSFYFGKNQTGSTIAKGTVVRANGTLGASGRILIAPAIGNNSTPPEYFMGVTAESIANGADGIVQWFGSIKGINTTGQNGETWANGDVLYLSSSVAGSLTNVEPVAPNQKTIVALVIYANANGTIFVRPTIGHTLQDVNNVNITSPANGDVLTYDSASGVWENAPAGGDVFPRYITVLNGDGTTTTNVNEFDFDYDLTVKLSGIFAPVIKRDGSTVYVPTYYG